MNLEKIDTSTTAGKAEVMRLAAEGRKVAQRTFPNEAWIEQRSPAWAWPLVDYAIIAEPVLDRPARVGGRDFPAGSLIQQVIGRAHAEYDRHHHSRDPRDVASDPEGILLCAAAEPLMAAQKREPVGPDEVFVSIHANGVFAAVHMVRPMVHQGDSIVRYVRADR